MDDDRSSNENVVGVFSLLLKDVCSFQLMEFKKDKSHVYQINSPAGILEDFIAA